MKIAKFFNKCKVRKYTNVIDASFVSRVIRQFTGSSVLELELIEGNRATQRFSFLGFFFFISWNAFYIFCAYTAQAEDQTILRNLYQTKLKRYGDDFERISSFAYVLLTMWVIPFRLCGNRQMMQIMIDLDKTIQDVGDILDYKKYAQSALLISVGQVGVYCLRMLCIWFPVSNVTASIPYEKMFQVIYSDAQAIIMTSIFCYFNIILRDRFLWVNRVLSEIKMQSAWEYRVFSRGKVSPNGLKVVQIQDRHICEKIKTCARVYSMLFNVIEIVNQLFGFAILITLIHYLNYIILYLFYFMEATASGLFHHTKRYIEFLIYGFWEVAIAIGVILLIVYSCESVVKEAKKTSFIVHEIINGDFSEEINCEAMQLSVQLLHEKPAFTVLGLFELNYAILQQGARSVCTYLVILLQFATKNDSGNTYSN